MTESLRLFVAVEVSDAVRDAVAQRLTALKVAAPNSRFVKPEKLHLTLQFLGKVEQAQLDAIITAIDTAATEVKPFQLGYSGGGSFGARVLWIGVTGELEALKALQQAVQSRLAKLGFEPEHREYSPHLTLARAKSLRGDKALKGAVELLSDFDVAPATVTRIVLMQSMQNKEGGEYRVLHSAAL
jgi:2'-5' RNA ligase